MMVTAFRNRLLDVMVFHTEPLSSKAFDIAENERWARLFAWRDTVAYLGDIRECPLASHIQFFTKNLQAHAVHGVWCKVFCCRNINFKTALHNASKHAIFIFLNWKKFRGGAQIPPQREEFKEREGEIPPHPPLGAHTAPRHPWLPFQNP